VIKRSAFYKQYKISGAEPIDVVKHRVPISTFTNTVIEFLDTEFTGLIDVECKPIWDINSCIRICEDYTAYFFKNLLAAFYGRESISIEMALSDDIFTIQIKSKEDFKIPLGEMNELLRIATSSGFSYELADSTLTLYSSVLRIKQTSVRSISFNRLRARFTEIFFTGGPAPDFRGWD